MFIDGRTLDKKTLDTALCIVGGGPAGIALALRFIGTDTQVTLIESGGLNKADKDTASLCDGEAAGLPYPFRRSRARMFGGTSNLWGGYCAPFSAIDFAARDWVPDSGWPFGAEALQDYYAQAATFLNLSNTANSDFTTPQDLWPDSDLAFHRWRFPPKLKIGKLYYDAIDKAKNIRVVLNSNITNINAGNDMKRVTSLDAKTLAGQAFTVRAKHYVLAAGGMENARLMLASNTHAAGGIGNANDVVGRYFMEHFHIAIAHIHGFGFPHKLSQFRNRRVNTALNIGLSDEAMQREKLLNCITHIPTRIKVRKPDKVMVHMARLLGKGIDDLVRLQLLANIEQPPNPENRVTLSAEKKDALGMPLTRVALSLSELEIKTAKYMANQVASTIASQELGVVRTSRWVDSMQSETRHWGFHHMGGTRMHVDPTKGVVDADCKVHGMENLHIAGSSVFPTSGWANPTYTLVALAIRLSDKLKTII